MQTNDTSIDPLSVTRPLALVAATLVVASVSTQYIDYLSDNSSMLAHKVAKLFDLDLELNIPAFFSMIILLTASLVLFAITFLKKRQSDKYSFQWAILSAGFFFMAFDEIASVHERLIEPMRILMGKENLGVFYFAWVVPAIVLIMLIGGYFLKFLIDLPSRTRRNFIIAAVFFLGGSIGLEMVSAKFSEIYGLETLNYTVLATFEEACEMGGVIIFIHGLLTYMAETYADLRVRFISAPVEIAQASAKDNVLTPAYFDRKPALNYSTQSDSAVSYRKTA